MTASELRRWLKARGCSFEDGKKHSKIILGRRITFMPRHPAKEIKTGTLKAILRDLDLQM
jgi:mRNA interferase HicA